jgi:hypothetical protein
MPFTLPPLPWKWIGIALAALGLIATIYFAIDAYGDARYDAGVSDTDKAWKAAAEKLEAEGQAAAEAADVQANTREEAWAAQVEREKEAIQDAMESGSSSLDAVFPSGM